MKKTFRPPLIIVFLLVNFLAPVFVQADGYILIAPMGSSLVQLINADKKVVHAWDCGEGPGNATYLEKGGTLLRTAKVDNDAFSSHAVFRSARTRTQPGGMGGRVRRFSWDGELLWDYQIAGDQLHQHHDVEPMPNGHVLVIAWEKHSKEEVIAAGRDPETIIDDSIWTETILEIKPVGKNGGEIVWKWRLWDHLIQEFDESKAKYGKVADHPGRVDFNYATRRGGADWIHMNSIDYNPELDQIALGARWFNEAWIIDHGTTTEEAAGSSGGKQGKGGDLLYRWGNPEAYQAGPADKRVFFAHHDVRWIERNCPGAGNLMVFNNGVYGEREYSSVDEFVPPVSENGSYHHSKGEPFGPEKISWSYSAPDDHFFSSRISGAQRLPNGNTLICSGSQGWVFEVTPGGERIWEIKVGDLVNPGITPAAKGKGGKGPKGGKGKGKGGKGGSGRNRGSVFRAPWYPVDYCEAFEKLPR